MTPNQMFGGNFAQALQKFKANPLQMIAQRRLNVPQSMVNDPSAIIQHLLSTGQISQDQLNNAYAMMQKIR